MVEQCDSCGIRYSRSSSTGTLNQMLYVDNVPETCPQGFSRSSGFGDSGEKNASQASPLSTGSSQNPLRYANDGYRKVDDRGTAAAMTNHLVQICSMDPRALTFSSLGAQAHHEGEK